MVMQNGKLWYTMNDVIELFKEDKNVRNYIYRKMKKRYNEKNKENLLWKTKN